MDYARWYESEWYQELTRATRAMDHAREIQIVEEAIANTDGVERALWIRYRAQRRLEQYVRPGEAVRGWAELPAILAAVPDDPDLLADAAIFALTLYLTSERTDLWAQFFPQIRQGIKPARRLWPWYANLAYIRRLQGRPYATMWACSKALAILDSLPANRRASQRGRYHFLHAQRAVAAVGCGLVERAENDLSRAIAIYAEFDRAYLAPYDLALAQAEVALAHRQFETARFALNEGMARSAISQHKPRPVNRIEFDLMAARIARAEGNMSSFQHFAQRALATCQEWDLRMSEVTVRAVMAGAER